MGQVTMHGPAGKTLLDVTTLREHRRVFARQHSTYCEVGESSDGPLTHDLFGAPTHAHSIHLCGIGQERCVQKLRNALAMQEDVGLLDLLDSFFSSGDLYLVDLMDALDGWGIPYGYLNTMVGSHVSYRPAHCA